MAALKENAAELEQQLGAGATVVVILHDAGTAYLDTVYSDEWVENTFGMSTEDCEREVREWGK